MRKGFDGLAALVQTMLQLDPHKRAQQALLIADQNSPLSYDEALYVYLYDALFASELRRRFPYLVKKAD